MAQDKKPSMYLLLYGLLLYQNYVIMTILVTILLENHQKIRQKLAAFV